MESRRSHRNFHCLINMFTTSQRKVSSIYTIGKEIINNIRDRKVTQNIRYIDHRKTQQNIEGISHRKTQQNIESLNHRKA